MKLYFKILEECLNNCAFFSESYRLLRRICLDSLQNTHFKVTKIFKIIKYVTNGISKIFE